MPPAEKEDTLPQYRMGRKIAKREEAIGMFLDIDGALLPLSRSMEPRYQDLAKEMFPGENFDRHHYIVVKVNDFEKSALDALDHLISTIIYNRKKPLVVISRNWCKELSVEEFRTMFGQHNFSKYC